jgi:mobilome CxxCx(11)CxxC protein
MSDFSVDQLRTEAWKKALETRGTAAIFSERTRRINTWSRIRDFLGIFVPLGVGVIVADVSFINSQFISALVAITAIPSLFQLGISLWSLVANWTVLYPVYVRSAVANNALCRDWEAFGKQTTPTTPEIFRVLSQKTDEQERIDIETNITPAERRYGMRYGLREYQKACATCGKVPVTMKPSECDTCGHF